MSKAEHCVLAIYVAGTGVVVVLSLAHDGLSADNVTRLLIIAYLAATFAWYWRTRERRPAPSRRAFVLKCSLSALVVEFCYMFSRPVFASLLVVPGTTPAQALSSMLIDFAFTFPVYLVIFSLFWWLITRYQYRVSEYALLFSLAQALGDGSAFFLGNPAMLIFIPYVMLNYQAMNIVPYLRIRDSIVPSRSGGAPKYVLPLVLIPATYWVMGAAIILVGRTVGLA